MWNPTTIRRFIQSVPTSTRVMRVDTDAGEGFLKAMGNPEGPHVLACELVGTLLATWLGLATLEHAIVPVTSEDELPFAQGGQAMPGPAFITKAIEGYPWGGDEETLRRLLRPEDLARMVVLDTWIRNCDRYRPSPKRVNRDNVFLAWESEPAPGIALRAIDHTHAFSCGGELTPRLKHLDNVQDTMIYGCFPEFAAFLTRPPVEAGLERLRAMDRGQAEAIVDLVPAEWEVDG